MKSVLVRRLKSSQPVRNDGTSCPSGSFDTSARLDVRAAMIRNQTWTTAAWRTLDSQNASAPEEYPVVTEEARGGRK